jgi:hypothetical protein
LNDLHSLFVAAATTAIHHTAQYHQLKVTRARTWSIRSRNRRNNSNNR